MINSPPFRLPEQGQAAETAAALGVIAAEAGIYQAAIDHDYSLPDALTGMLMAGAVLTASVLVILRRVGARSTGSGGQQPPKQV